MSYNVYGNWNGLTAFLYYGFTDLDKRALQANWGLNPESYTSSNFSPTIPQDTDCLI